MNSYEYKVKKKQRKTGFIECTCEFVMLRAHCEGHRHFEQGKQPNRAKTVLERNRFVRQTTHYFITN